VIQAEADDGEEAEQGGEAAEQEDGRVAGGVHQPEA